MGMQLWQNLPHPLIVVVMVGVMAWLGAVNIRESWHVLGQGLLNDDAPP